MKWLSLAILLAACTSPKRKICMDLNPEDCRAAHLGADDECLRFGDTKEQCDERHAKAVNDANESPEVRQIYRIAAQTRPK